MTSPVNVSGSMPASVDSASAWLRDNARSLGIGAVAAVVLAGGLWFYRYSKAETEQRAERDYYQAEQSLLAGNFPLAQSDLQKVVARYDGTRSADQARLGLAQAFYAQGKYQEGMHAIEPVVSRSGQFSAAAEALTAAGFEELGKPADAAAHYRSAAAAAKLSVDKSIYEADAARAYAAAGAKDSAVALWTRLGEDLRSPVAAESRVRIGELTAKPAGR